MSPATTMRLIWKTANLTFVRSAHVAPTSAAGPIAADRRARVRLATAVPPRGGGSGRHPGGRRAPPYGADRDLGRGGGGGEREVEGAHDIVKVLDAHRDADEAFRDPRLGQSRCVELTMRGGRSEEH